MKIEDVKEAKRMKSNFDFTSFTKTAKGWFEKNFALKTSPKGLNVDKAKIEAAILP